MIDPSIKMFAIHPVFFVPVHMALPLIISKVYPKKEISTPLLFGGFFFHMLIEHFTESMGSLANLLGCFAPIFILTVLGFFYLCYQQSNNKIAVLQSLVAFFVVAGLLKGLEAGFPKDTAPEQVVANRDVFYTWCHFSFHLIHIVLLHNAASTCPGDYLVQINSQKRELNMFSKAA